MRRTIAMLGIFLTAMVLISGSAVATWVHAISQTNNYCTNAQNAVGGPDDNYASLGQDGPPPILGWILLDLGSSNAMPNSQDFTVFALSTTNETYDVSVAPASDPGATQYVGTGWDTENLTFQTPSTGNDDWRYIFLEGKSGVNAFSGGDYYYGPDIDAVGWDKP